MEKLPADYSSRPHEWLELRAEELLDLLNINHNEERFNQISRELAHVSFELMWRDWNGE